MRKMISIGLLVLMITGLLVVMDVSFLESVEANNIPTDRGDSVLTNTPGGGDWIIEAVDDLTFTDVTIILNSNLTIKDGGKLKLTHVTLMFNCTYDGEFGINVEAGPGSTQLTINANGFGGSNITANRPPEAVPPGAPFRYFFIVDHGTTFSMMDSELHDCGWAASEPDLSDAGMNIQTANAVITNNDISNNFRGIILNGLNARAATITGNTIHHNDRSAIYIANATNLPSSPTVISDNDISNQIVGVHLENTLNIIIDDSVGVNNFYNHTNFGVNAYAVATLDILNNNFNGNGDGIYVNFGLDIMINGNTIIGNPTQPAGLGIYTKGILGGSVSNNVISETGQYDMVLGGPRGIWLDIGTNDTTAYNNEIFNVQDGVGLSLTSAGTGPGNNITTNYIHDNPGSIGILAWGHDCDVYNNTVTNNEYGIYIYGTTDPSVGDHPTYSILVSENFVSKNVAFGSNLDYGGITTLGYYTYGDVNNVTFSHNQIIDNNLTLSDAIGGHHIIRADAITIIEEEITNNDYNLWADNSKVTIINSTLTLALATYDIYMDNNARVRTINTSFDKNAIGYSDGTNSELKVQWYMHVKVRDGGLGVDGAEVYINDTFSDPDPPIGQPFTTANGGWVNWLTVTEFIEIQTSRTYYTPHHLEARTSTQYGWNESFIDEYKIVFIDFDGFIIHIPLKAGGNMISIPFNMTNDSLEEVLLDIEGNYTTVWWYNISDNINPWKLYDVDKPVADLHSVGRKMGIWIFMSSDDTLTVTGSEPIPSTTNIDLKAGWNFIGYPSLTPRFVGVNPGEAFNSISGFVEIVQYYNATNITDPWKEWDPGSYTQDDLIEIKPCYGLWIRVTEDCIWSVDW